jgi:hypothetical protein
MVDRSTLLVKEVRELALQEGAILFGISGVARFEGAPRGHHPAEILKGAQTVVSFAIPLVEQVADWEELFIEPEVLKPEIRKTMLQDYLYAEVNYNFINDRLYQIAHRVAIFLQARGFRSILFPATFAPPTRAFTI